MKWEEINIDELKAQFTTHDNLLRKIEENYGIVEKQQAEIEDLDENIKSLTDSVSKLNTELHNKELRLREIEDTILSKEKDNQKIIDNISEAEKRLEDIKKDIAWDKEELEESVMQKEAVLQSKTHDLLALERAYSAKISKLESDIYNYEQSIQELEVQSKAKQDAIKHIDSLLSDKQRKLQGLNWEIIDLEENKSIIQQKRDILDSEIQNLLKQGKEAAVKYKVTKSRASRLDWIINKFNS